MAKRMMLDSLEITNFKGIKHLKLDFSGENLTIAARNGAGKTTIADAYSWLMTDKDSTGRKDFDIIPIDPETKQTIHNIETSVKGVFGIELGDIGEQITLKKVFKEEWTKKRGSTEATLTGHTSEYFINDMDIPVKKTQYQARLSQYFSEDTFRMLSNPNYFNSIHWKDRRDILFSLTDDITMSDIIALYPKFEELKDMQNLGIKREHLQKQLTAIAKKIDEKPIQIAENQKRLQDIGNLDSKALDATLEHLLSEKTVKENQVNAELAVDWKAAIRAEIEQIDLQMTSLLNEFTQRQYEENQNINNKIVQVSKQINSIDGQISGAEYTISSLEAKMAENEQLREKLRAEYTVLGSKKCLCLETCPTCSQTLPSEIVKQSRETFEQNKVYELKQLNNKGSHLKAEYDDMKVVYASSTRELPNLRKKKDELLAQKEELENLFTMPKTKVEDGEKYQALVRERETLLEKQRSISDGADLDKVATMRIEIAEIDRDIHNLTTMLSKVSDCEKIKQRIAEIATEEKALADEYREHQRLMYLIDEFNKLKCEILTEKINGKFKIAKWQLFEQNINGNIDLVCECIIDGVPYSRNLNTAMKVNVGLDCINTLSRHYGVSVPIFVDNRESVTELEPVDGQIISLVVAPDRELK